MRKSLLLLFALLVLLAGCANEGASSEIAEEADATGTAVHDHHHEHEPADEPAGGNPDEADEAAPSYTLAGSVNERMELLIETNLTFSEENYGRAHKEGEGHVHLYINGRLIGPLKHAGPHEIVRHLQDGDNEIKLALASNSHNEAAYNTKYHFTVAWENPADQAGE